MANRERGEVAFEVDGRTYTFCLDLNGLTELEAMFSTPTREVGFVEIVGKAEAGHARYIRAVFWAALRKYQPDITLEQTSDLVQAIGGLFGGQLQAVLQQATGGARPDPKDVAELGEGVKKRPRKAQGQASGIGESSTSRPAAVA